MCRLRCYSHYMMQNLCRKQCGLLPARNMPMPTLTIVRNILHKCENFLSNVDNEGYLPVLPSRRRESRGLRLMIDDTNRVMAITMNATTVAMVARGTNCNPIAFSGS